MSNFPSNLYFVDEAEPSKHSENPEPFYFFKKFKTAIDQLERRYQQLTKQLEEDFRFYEEEIIKQMKDHDTDTIYCKYKNINFSFRFELVAENRIHFCPTQQEKAQLIHFIDNHW